MNASTPAPNHKKQFTWTRAIVFRDETSKSNLAVIVQKSDDSMPKFSLHLVRILPDGRETPHMPVFLRMGQGPIETVPVDTGMMVGLIQEAEVWIKQQYQVLKDQAWAEAEKQKGRQYTKPGLKELAKRDKAVAEEKKKNISGDKV
jgi:hypothetical protein